jgi:hypothetical protein
LEDSGGGSVGMVWVVDCECGGGECVSVLALVLV